MDGTDISMDEYITQLLAQMPTNESSLAPDISMDEYCNQLLTDNIMKECKDEYRNQVLEEFSLNCTL